MRSLILALVVASVAAVLAFVLLVTFGMDKDLAKTAATVVVGLFPAVHKSLDRPFERRDENLVSLPSFEQFCTRPSALFAYAIAVLLAFRSATQYVIGLAAGAQMADPSLLDAEVMRIASVGQVVSVPAAHYLVGRWIGIRSRRHGFTVAVSSALVAQGSVNVIDVLRLESGQFSDLFGVLPTGTNVLLGFLMAALVVLLPASVGYEVGSRRRVAEYLWYLVRRTLPADRQAIVELAHESAQAARNKRIPSADHPTSSPRSS
jgi:hypothetical protein